MRGRLLQMHRKQFLDPTNAKHSCKLQRHHRRQRHLIFEELERRALLATITWIGTTGSFHLGTNWDLGRAPASGDIVVIPEQVGDQAITYSSGSLTVASITAAERLIVAGGTLGVSGLVSASTALLQTGGVISQATISPTTRLDVSGGSLGATIQGEVRILSNSTSTLTGNTNVSGSLTIQSGATVTLASGSALNVTGLLQITDATIRRTNTFYTAPININAGGRLSAANSTFSPSQLAFDNAAIINAGDLVNNRFDTTLSVPQRVVPLLSAPAGSDNRRFQDINIQFATLSTGTLNLNVIGTESTTSLRYSFPAGFKVSSGATLNVSANVPVLLPIGQTLTIDGAVTMATGSTLSLGANYPGGTQVAINGTLTANGATFNQLGSGYGNSLTVNSGGRLIAANSTFAVGQVYWHNGSVLNADDLTNNIFNQPIHLPAASVSLLSAAGGGSDNQRFQDINIHGGTLASGNTLNLNAIGTASTTSLRYIFPAGLTVTAGATLNVGANVPVLLPNTQVLTIHGAVTMATGSTLSLGANYPGGTQVAINGTLTAIGATFNQNGSGYGNSLTVNSGGRLIAANSTFAVGQVYWHNGSVLDAGDLTNNSFNLPIYLPAASVSLLSAAGGGSDNQRFQDINILGGTLTSGSTLNLNSIGTASTTSLRYIFPAGFTVAAGATLNVGANVPVLLPNTQVLTIHGAATMDNGSTLSLGANYPGGTQVAIHGTLTASGATFNQFGSGYSNSLTVNNNGRLIATNSTFAVGQVYWNNGSVLSAGNLANNNFTSSIYLPAAHIPLISDNQRFQDINILGGTLTSGNTLNLNAIGTVSTTSLRYIFSNNFLVADGATLNIGSAVPVYLPVTQTLTIDGAMSMAAGSRITLDRGYPGGSSLLINGTLTTASATLNQVGSNYLTSLTINSGGRLIATNSTFSVGELVWKDGSVLNAGDLSNNNFNLPIYLAADRIAHLSSTGGGSDNRQFQDINIWNGTLPAGSTLNLDAIGTESTANLRYVFFAGFSIANGATLSVAPNVSVLVGSGQILTINGQANLAPNSNLILSALGSTVEVFVNGVLQADAASISQAGNYIARVTVNSGGRLQAHDSTIALHQLNLHPLAVLQAGDLANNRFDTTLLVPHSAIPLLAEPTGSNNRRFQNVVIHPGTLNNVDLQLSLMGTESTANLRYQLSSLTVGADSSLVIAENVRASIMSAQTLTVDGQLELKAGSLLTIDASSNFSYVHMNGEILVNSATVERSGNYIAELSVRNLAKLTATNSTFNGVNLNLLAGSTNVFSSTAGGVENLGGTGSLSPLTHVDVLRAANGAAVFVPNSLQIDGDAIVHIATGSTLNIGQNLLGNTTNPALFEPQGRIKWNGGGTALAPRRLEAMSRDLGRDANGFEDSNFLIGEINVANNTYLRLTDLSDNSFGTEKEAIYTNSLVVTAGSTLDLTDIKLYTRAIQWSGTIIGTPEIIADSGELIFDSPTPGAIDPAGQVDEWTFFNRAGNSVTIQVNPSSTGLSPALPPVLNWARVQLIGPDDQIIAESTTQAAGNLLTLNNVQLPSDGVYKVRVTAAPAQVASIGNYAVTAWNTRNTIRPLIVNQTLVGELATPFDVNTWEFTATAGQQIQFDLRSTTTPLITFSLAGPGFTPFTDTTEDSLLLNLPADGRYTLTVRSPQGAAGDYAFVVNQTTVTDIALGVAATGNFTGNGQPHLYRVEVPTPQVLTFELDDAATTGRTELYARFGLPPTRENYDYASTSAGRSHDLFIPSGSPGYWYVLVYGESVPQPGNYTLLAQGATAKLESSYPTHIGNSNPLMLTLRGAGFEPGTTVELVADGGTIVTPTSFTIDLHSQITAHFPRDLYPGTYDVRVRIGGSSDTLTDALVLTNGGRSNLETNLILPTALGRRAVGTIYLEYANTGDAAMPAPLLSLQSNDANDSDKPILTLDETRLVENFWSAGLPPGTSNSVMILGSGQQPGVLNPGERIRVPVHFLGLQQPWDMSDNQVEMEIRYWTEDDRPYGQAVIRLLGGSGSSYVEHDAPENGESVGIDWAAQQESLRPPLLTSEQWAPIYTNLTSQIPNTREYVRMLNENARYLGRLGLNVTSLDELWNFEVQQAYGYTVLPTLDSAVDAALPVPGVSLDFPRRFGSSIQSRNATGPLGRGWFSPWQTKLIATSELVQIVGEGGSARTFQRDIRNGSFFSGVGDSSKLTAIGGGVYELRSVDGTVTRFRSDGRIDYVRDVNGNQVTATYLDGLLQTLTHSSGASLSFLYNTVGHLARVTDSAGRATNFTYDATDTYLRSVTTPDGKITRYTYETGGNAQQRHALLSIERGGTTQYFDYDARGRVDRSYLASNTQVVDYIYDNAGLVSINDASGTSSLFFDHQGLLVKSTDALGYISSSEYDENLRLSRSISPTGESQSFAWCDCGSMTSVTNELGQTTTFAYDNPFRRMTSFTDARGNTTTYTYDAKGNLLKTIYPDGSYEQLAGYTPSGLPGVATNRRSQALSYLYNAGGQVTKQTFADGSFIVFAYDTRGNLQTVTDGLEITTYTYDYAVDGDRLRRITYPNGRYLDYLYDTFGRRVRMTDQDGFQTRYEYDGAGRLYRLRDAADTLLVTYTYDISGRLGRIDKGNGTFTTYEYDAAGQLLSLKNWRNATTLNSQFDYVYDSRGRRVTMTTLDGTWTYGYDGTGQLTRAVFASLNQTLIPNQDLQYFYDAAGNRIRTVLNGVTTEYVTNELNQYTRVGGVVYTYDADGNLTFDGENTYEWDQQGRLVRVTGPEGVTEYEYDAFGNRVAKVENGDRKEYLNDSIEQSNVISEYNAAGPQNTHYLHGNGLIGSSSSSGAWNFFDFDAAGSTSGISDSTGSYLNEYAYSPNGTLIAIMQSIANPFRFIGEHGVSFDLSDTFYMRARYYDSDTGRFASLDPIRLSGGDNNFYRYSHNDSVNRVDPSGLCDKPQWAGLGTLLSAGGTYVGLIRALPVIATFGPFGAFAATIAGLGYTGYLGYVAARRFGGDGSGHVTVPFQSVVTQGILPAYGWLNIPGGIGSLLACNWKNVDSIVDKIKVGGGNLLDKIEIQIRNAFDPNQKLPGIGYGPEAYVAGGRPIPYRIDFENYSTATAPAQQVTISDFLSADFDWSSFRVTEVGYGSTLITVPGNVQHFQTTRSMTYNGKTFDVLIEAGLRAATGEVYAIFQSLDPRTELPPEVLYGFLPPEDGTGRGMGHVSYVIRPRATLPSGHEIRNVALISFDGQLAISTDQVDPLDPSQGIDLNKQARVTIDAAAPVSQMTPLPAVSANGLNVSWSAVDDANGSGVASYDVFVSVNGGAFQLWLDNFTETSVNFGGVGGRTYRFAVQAADQVGNVETGFAAVAGPVTIASSFQPLDVAQTASGVVVSYMGQFDITHLNAVDLGSQGGPADITLRGANSGNVRGSVVVDQALRTLTFVATSGVLLPDLYTLTLRSAADGFQDAEGLLMDGNADGTAGGDLIQTFTVQPPQSGAVTISIPNIARGPLQPANFPVTLSNASGLTEVEFQITYDPLLLTIEDAVLAANLPEGAAVSIDTSTPGIAAIHFTSPTALAAGSLPLLEIISAVPSSAPYRAKQVIDLTNVSLNGGSIPARDDDAIQVVAYFGDLTGNGTYSALDAALAARLAVGIDLGLQDFVLLDPTILGDITGNGGFSSTDTSKLLQAAVGISVPEIPEPLPTVSLTQGGPDPKLSIPQDLSARAGDDIMIPVHIDSIVDLTGNGMSSADLVIYFDAAALEVTSVNLGSLVQHKPGWMIATRIDALAGRIFISLGGTQALEGVFQGELVQLQAKVKAGAKAGSVAINLAESSRSPARFTQVNEGFLTLIPAPTNSPHDAIDGLLTIIAAENAAINSATARLVAGQLLIHGTAGNDHILVASRGGDQVRVRANNRVLGTFSAPAGIAIDGLTGEDSIYVDPNLPATIIADSASDDRDLIFAAENTQLTSTTERFPSTNREPRTNPTPEHDEALLELLAQWFETHDEWSSANPSSRRPGRGLGR